MDEFERRLARRMKHAAGQQVDLAGPASDSGRRGAVQVAVVVLCTVLAVALGFLVVNRGDDPPPVPNILHPSRYPPAPPAGDPAVWSLAPHQNLSAGSTEFTALVSRLGCNSGVTGRVLGPGVILTTTSVTVTFTVPHTDGGRCPSNDRVPIKVRLSDPLGHRALVDGQCLDTAGAARTAFCTANHGVRWSGRGSATPGSLTRAEFQVAVRVAQDEQSRVTGTFVGATASAHRDTFKKDCPSGRTLHIRLVWERDANFDHSGIGLPDGPRKAWIVFADPKTGDVCRTSSTYRHVGASPRETLLYGQWPDPRDG